MSTTVLLLPASEDIMAPLIPPEEPWELRRILAGKLGTAALREILDETAEADSIGLREDEGVSLTGGARRLLDLAISYRQERPTDCRYTLRGGPELAERRAFEAELLGGRG